MKPVQKSNGQIEKRSDKTLASRCDANFPRPFYRSNLQEKSQIKMST